jgi:formate-dependent nitrite reductase membrane component NrfD
VNTFVADPAWSWWIILYFYLGGLAAGGYFLATLIELFGHEEDRPLATIGYRLAFPLVCICAVLLIVDLERPDRFYHMVLQSEAVKEVAAGNWSALGRVLMLKPWSPMSIGAQALGLFGLCSLISLLGTFRPRSWLARGPIGWSVKVVGCFVGFFIASYTGALLTASNQPLWSDTDWIAPLFLTSAASTGMALLLLLGRPVTEEGREHLERADLWALSLELFVFLVFLASLGGELPYVLATPEGLLLVLGTLVLGLLVPLGLHLLLVSPGRVVVAAISALVGGFLLRYGVVRVVPEFLRHSPHLTAADVEAPLIQHWSGVVLLTLTLVLVVVIPVVLARRWQLSGFPLALSGVLPALTLAGVLLYSLTPMSERPTFAPVLGLQLSPEAGRERGGGFGASASNRPVHPALSGKLPGQAAP